MNHESNDNEHEIFEEIDEVKERKEFRDNFCCAVFTVSVIGIFFFFIFQPVIDFALLVGLLIAVGMLIVAVYSCIGILRTGGRPIKQRGGFTELLKEADQVDESDSELEREDGSESNKKPIPGVAHALSEIESIGESEEAQVIVRRGGEFIGNRMRMKVKVLNQTPYLIADVTVYILTYPQESLKYSGEDHHIFFTKIEPGGFRSPTFDFLPTQDCVKGEIVAGISYVDMKGKPHTLTTRPFVIRSVCDLLLPQRVGAEDFELRLKDLECGEIVIKIDEWTPEEMYDKALRIVDESNFFEVSSKIEKSGDNIHAKIDGFAQGKYTGKEVAVEIHISGPAGTKGASCTIRVSGEDQAMILPAIDDLKERLSAWLCPMCSSPLTLKDVEALRKGKVIQCSFCSVSIGR